MKMKNNCLLLIILMALSSFISCSAGVGDSSDGSSDETGNSSDTETGMSGVCDPYLIKNIINGEECQITRQPVVPIAFIDPSSGEFADMCTGTMIEEDKVLTAAHCTNKLDLGYIALVYYDNEAFSVPTWYTHPGFFIQGSPPTQYDVGIMILDERTSVTPVPVFVSGYLTEGDEVQIMGYGITEDSTGGFGSDLKGGTMVIAGMTEELTLNAYYETTQQSTCGGDSGGPALYSYSGIKMIGGITSYVGSGCQSYAGFVIPYLVYDFLDTYAPNATYY